MVWAKPKTQSKSPRYGAVVSLGAACQVAEQCRRHLGAAPGGPFDWLVTPFEAIEKVLADRGGGFGRRFVTTSNGRSAQCVNYGVVYEHDFQRNENGQVVYDVDYIDACRSRATHKMGKLINILSSKEKVLFIRAYSSTGVDNDRFNDSLFTSDDVNALVATIEHHAPDLDFDFLFIHSRDRAGEKTDFSKPLSDRVILREMAHPADMEWFGIDADWRTVFQDLGMIGAGIDMRSRTGAVAEPV